MYVEPLQALGLLTRDLPEDTWDDVDWRDAVWLAAADHWLRRTFLLGAPMPMLNPSGEDVRIAGASYGCAIFYCPPDPRRQSPFLFAGDELKLGIQEVWWDESQRSDIIDPRAYERLARRIAEQSAERWGLNPENADRYRRLQALVWSVQDLRIQFAQDGRDPSDVWQTIGSIVAELGLRGDGPLLGR